MNIQNYALLKCHIYDYGIILQTSFRKARSIISTLGTTAHVGKKYANPL